MELDKIKLKWLPRFVKAKNITLNFPFWLFQTVKFRCFMFFMRMKIRVLVRYARIRRWIANKKWYFQMRMAGYTFIKPERFITEFPPRKGHKNPICRYGQGWSTVMLPNKQKMIQFCDCVVGQYKKSGKKYMIIQPK